MDVTTLFSNFRECSKAMWNGHFLNIPEKFQYLDTLDDYIELREEIFIRLVLAPIHKESLNRKMISSYKKGIRLVPTLNQGKCVFLWAKAIDNAWKWNEMTTYNANIDCYYLDLFDWDSEDNIQLEYVRGRIIECKGSNSNIRGADALFKFEDVKFVVM